MFHNRTYESTDRLLTGFCIILRIEGMELIQPYYTCAYFFCTNSVRMQNVVATMVQLSCKVMSCTCVGRNSSGRFSIQ